MCIYFLISPMHYYRYMLQLCSVTSSILKLRTVFYRRFMSVAVLTCMSMLYSMLKKTYLEDQPSVQIVAYLQTLRSMNI
jgi:hypothetical protein